MPTQSTAPLAVVRKLDEPSNAQLHQLADLLMDAVEGGASVSFMQPLGQPKALQFWRDVASSAARRERLLFVAEDASGIVGSVQLIVSQPDNQPHRADIAKMLVHRRARRQGLGAALMHASEAAASALGKTLLVLDTASPEAARLYARAGWIQCGVIPGYALLPQGGLCDTTYFYRSLG